MILHTNIAWEAGGGLAFMSAREVSVTKINNRLSKCTDIAMQIETEVAQRRPDVTCIPNFGTYVRESSIGDIEAFVKLASGRDFCSGVYRTCICPSL